MSSALRKEHGDAQEPSVAGVPREDSMQVITRAPAAEVPGWRRVANRLSDGRWHTSYELTHDLDVMAHSRVAQLRGKGYSVDHRLVAGAKGLRAHEYRLVATPSEAPVAGASLGAGAIVADGCLPVEPAAPNSQLVLV